LIFFWKINIKKGKTCGRLKQSSPVNKQKGESRMVHRRVRGGKFKIKHVEKQCPVTLGDEIEVNITDICPSGDGTSMIQGYIIQVPKAKPRDHVKVKIVSVGKKTAIGEIIK